MIMLKDNHIDFAGGITNAINLTKVDIIRTKCRFISFIEFHFHLKISGILLTKYKTSIKLEFMAQLLALVQLIYLKLVIGLLLLSN